MLSLEVMGPGGSLSMVLIAMPYWRDASQRESWQAATATAAYSWAYSCNRMAAALIHQLGSGRRWQRRSGIGFRQRWIQNYFCLIVFVLFSLIHMFLLIFGLLFEALVVIGQ